MAQAPVQPEIQVALLWPETSRSQVQEDEEPEYDAILEMLRPFDR